MLTKALRCLLLVFVIFLPMHRAVAEIAIGKWVLRITEPDRFSDRSETYFQLLTDNVQSSSTLGKRKLSLILFCPVLKIGEKSAQVRQGLVSFDPLLQLYQPSLTYRFDHAPAGRLYDPSVTKVIALGNLDFSAFLTSLSNSSRLLIRIHSEVIGTVEAEFQLDGAKEVVSQFKALCPR